jgi:aminopeptidase
MDKRWIELGNILVNYSTEVKPGERVMIAMKEAHTLPLVRAVYEAAVKAGAYPQVQFVSDYLAHSLMRYGSPEQVGWLAEIEAHGMDWADVYIGLRGAHNLYEFSDIGADMLARHNAAQGKISALRWQKTRWCLIRVPDESLAQDAETDIETMLDIFFSACLRDWAAESRHWREVAQKFEGSSLLRLTGKDTDLSFSVEGRPWLVADGKENMPDGEIWTAPINPTLDGCIYFELPAALGGRVVEGIRLAWEKGKLVSASATHNRTTCSAYSHSIRARAFWANLPSASTTG